MFEIVSDLRSRDAIRAAHELRGLTVRTQLRRLWPLRRR